jgi:hypothetical protein
MLIAIGGISGTTAVEVHVSVASKFLLPSVCLDALFCLRLFILILHSNTATEKRRIILLLAIAMIVRSELGQFCDPIMSIMGS